MKKKVVQSSPKIFVFDGGCNIGSSTCSVGYVRDVIVEEMARNCGISTILTTLCFIDQDLNGLEGNLAPGLVHENRGLDEIQKASQDKYDWITQNCRSLWSLFAIPSPKYGGFGYFSAAMKSGFDQMLIKTSRTLYSCMEIHGPDSTEKWSGMYSAETGIIEDPSGDIRAYSTYWFFCNSKAS